MKRTIACIAYFSMLLGGNLTFAQTVQQPKKSVWDNGHYLNDRQKTVMGYLSSWNLKSPLGPELYYTLCAHRGVFGKDSKGLISKFNVELKKRFGVQFPTTLALSENSFGSYLATFGLNNKKGIEMVELDVRLTKDKVPVILHDQTIGRATDPKFDPRKVNGGDMSFKGGGPNNRKVDSLDFSKVTRKQLVTWFDEQSRYTSDYRKFGAPFTEYNQLFSLHHFLWVISREYNYSLKGRTGAYPRSNFPILVLDVKDEKALRYCIAVVRNAVLFLDRKDKKTKRNAFNWIIFKLDVSKMWVNNPPKGQDALSAFYKKIKISGVNPYSLNIVPVFHTRTPTLISAKEAAIGLNKKPYFFTFEFNAKEGAGFGSIGKTNRTCEITDLVNRYNFWKLGNTHVTPSAYFPPSYIASGKFFDGFGGCCSTFSDFYLKNNGNNRSYKPNRCGNPDLPLRYDLDDYRWNTEFLINGLTDGNGFTFRWITTDKPHEWIRDRGDFYLGNSNYLTKSIGANAYSTFEGDFSNDALDVETIDTSDVETSDTSDVETSDTSDVQTSDYQYEIPVLSCKEEITGYSAIKVQANVFSDMYFIGKDSLLYQVDADNKVINWKVKAIDLAVEENRTPWYIGSNNRIYSLDSNNNWYALPGLAKKIAIGGASEEDADFVTENQTIAIVGMDNYIYTLNSSSRWTRKLNVAVKEISVDKSGNIWYIDMNNRVWRLYDDSPINTNGIGKKISCSLDGSIAVIGSDDNIWGFKTSNNRWYRVYSDGTKFTNLSLVHALSALALSADGKIWSITDDCSDESALSSQANNEVSSIVSNDRPVASKITVFPNPANDKVTVQLSVGMEKATVSVVNMLGATIATDNSVGLQRTFNLSGQAKGVYLVRVQDGKNVIISKKLVVQ